MLEEFVGKKVVVDLYSSFVCLGTLQRIDEHYLELHGADLHDLRNTDAWRENYVAAAHATGIKRESAAGADRVRGGDCGGAAGGCGG